MIEKFIIDYLTSNRRLVIPEVGALLKKEDAGFVFVPFLNRDDGVLVQIIMNTRGISATEAAAVVKLYAATVKDSLNDKGFYIMAGMGTLRADSNGILFLDTNEQVDEPAVVKPAVHKPAHKPAEPALAENPKAGPAAGHVKSPKPAAAVSRPAAVKSPEHTSAHGPKPVPTAGKRADWVLIGAVIVALIAAAIMIYSVFSSSQPPEM